MRAMRYHAYNGPLVLDRLPIPTPAPSQVVVKIHASSINPIDWKIHTGQLKIFTSVPCVPGFDIAGEIFARAPEVTAPNIAVGQRVYCRIKALSQGASGEYVAVDQGEVCPIPEGMSYKEAAAVPLAAMTAVQTLRDKLELPLESGASAGKRVLVVGASGGVGHFAVQIAKAAGAHVTGICSTRNVDFVKGLGADEVLDYTQPNFLANVASFDAVCDCYGNDYQRYLGAMKETGSTYCTVLAAPGVALRSAVNWFSQKKIRWMLLSPNLADLQLLSKLWSERKLRVHIDSAFPLEKLQEAWDRSKSNRAVGKIVVLNLPEQQ
jgi:NADPH:quinone reductase-like Zn-dependent oxidoreductase